ncbi:MAG: polyprenyl synthetase family protein [Candidatus Methanodesulfokora sp.]|jgi:geranylgeranyl diphosphate synthase type I
MRTSRLDEFASYYIPLINKSIAELLERRMKRDNEVVKKYYEKIKGYVLAGGKRARPIAFLVSYMGSGGDDVNRAVKASISVELLHNSSLAHDDIMDESETRRGLPALHVQYDKWFKEMENERFSAPRNSGISLGILGGDSLLELGIEAILESGFPEKATTRSIEEYIIAYRRLIEGQLLDMYLSGLTMPSVEQIIEMLKLKTGALYAASLKMGAILAGRDDLLDDLEELGFMIGIAFQIRDDILGLFGDPNKTGKPVDSDIKQGKRTILVTKAYEVLSEDKSRKLVSLLGKKDLTDDELEFVRKAVVESGALSFSQLMAEEYMERCKSLIDELEMRDDQKEILKEIAERAVKRDR